MNTRTHSGITVVVIALVLRLAAATLVGAFMGPVHASSSKPHYDTPNNVVAFAFGPTLGEVTFNHVKYADFYEVDISTSKKMTHPSHVVTDIPGVNGIDLPNLEPDTRYYVTVEVCSSRAESLSHDSKVATFRTDPATP